MLIITNPAINTNLGHAPGLFGGNIALQGILSGLVSLVLAAGGVIAFFLLLWGGYEYMTAGGDKEGTQRATKRITAALIGLAILLSSFAIIYILEVLFDINLLAFSIPTI